MAKKLLYHSGLLSAYHRWRNRRSLTVAMFHRVLPAGDAAGAESDPAFSMTTEVFGACLAFFGKHYNVIGMADLLRAAGGQGKLPGRALLITFDDGWADTAEYAMPLLRNAGMPATVFVVAGAVGEPEFWRESLICAWRRRVLRNPDYLRMWELAGLDKGAAPADWSSMESVWKLIGHLGRLEAGTRAAVLEEFRPALGRPTRPQMVSETQFQALCEAGITIGSHGLTHTPIPYSSDAKTELESSRESLSRRLGTASQSDVNTFSFPHGIHDQAAIAAAGKAGYRLLFTSVPSVSAAPAGRSLPSVFGRINVNSMEVSDGRAGLRPELLAMWLFSRPRAGAGNRA